MVAGIGGPEFDLCTIGASDPAYTVLAGLGFPLGDDLKGADLEKFRHRRSHETALSRIRGHARIRLRDNRRQRAFGPGIADTRGRSGQRRPFDCRRRFQYRRNANAVRDRDTEIDITAQTGIKSLDVTIDCDNLDAKELGKMGHPGPVRSLQYRGLRRYDGTRHPAEDVREAISALGSPRCAVKDKPSIRLKIDKMFTGLLAGFPATTISYSR